ncbi:MAG: T9SS type A sorting domain-containing protein [Candidatus Marinimicrobia bacterium]|nr:T9SS type A sorting domain-containing protein [Candidatus Neomarinimicrobiota bacterium]
MIEGGAIDNPIWIGLTSAGNTYKYWEDESYSVVDVQYATIVDYSIDHSAITTDTIEILISKWGDGPLMRHGTTGYGTISKYLRKNPATPSDFITVLEAINDAVPNQIVHVDSGVPVLSCNISISENITLKIHSGAILELDTCSIIFQEGSLFIATNAEISPYFCLKEGMNVKGLYPSFLTALNVATSGQTIEIGDNVSLTTSTTIPSGITLKFATGKSLNTSVSLNATNVTFTSLSGTWGGIKYNSGSSGTLNNCTISNSTYGVYCNSSSPTIENSNISNCTYGVYNNNGSSDIYDNNIVSGTYGIYNYNGSGYNTISGNTISSSYGIYNYASSSIIRDNEITSSTVGLYCDNYSSPELLTGGNYFHGNYVIFGVYADNNSNPSMGVAWCMLDGEHSFVYNGFDIALVNAGTNCSIWAENNWWGTSSPYAGMFSGSVDWNPYLQNMPTYSMQPNPENDIYDQTFNRVAVQTDDQTDNDLINYYDEAWSLDQKIKFLRYLVHYNEATGVPALCKEIIETYPYSPEAFTALDIIYQVVINENAAKDIDKESLKIYLKTFEEKKGNKMLNGSALLMLAGLEKKEGLSRIDAVYTANKDNYLGEYALYQKFMYYVHDEEDMETAKSVLDLMDEVYPESRVSYEAHLLIGDEVISPEEFYSRLQKKTEAEQMELVSTDIDEIIPAEYALDPAVPNPFNPSTALEFDLPVQSKVQCGIYDVRGNLVKEYSYEQNAGTYSIVWDGSNVSSGIYLIRFVAEASDGTETFVDYQRVTLLK